jgi:hypothetical protein
LTLNTDQRDQIAALWWEGETSPRISKELGITRNRVMGHVSRAKLKRSPTAKAPSRRGGGNHRKDRPQPSALLCNGNVPVVLDYKQVLNRTDTTHPATTDTCKWPVGTNLLEDGFFCGAAAKRGPYCKHHAAIAYNNPLNYRR